MFVTDAPGAKTTQVLAQGLATPLLSLNDVQKQRLAANANLVFDLDLRNVDTVRQVRRLLNDVSGGCRVFLVENNYRVTSVHAQVLGADVVLSRPCDASRIWAAILNYRGLTLRTGANAIAQQSINDGMHVLNQGFQSLIDDAVFDSVETSAASGRIADAINDLGAQQWLEAVKGYHAGTFQHCMLVTGVAAAFASGLGMNRPDVVKLTLAGMLHDIGKAAIPLEILDKPGALSASELLVLRRHPVVGHDYLSARSSIPLGILRNVRHHHEMLDGTGYPDGLRGSEIDDITRIVTICDIYSALIEQRSYKAARSPNEAMAILESMVVAGKLEDSLVREFGRIMVPRN